MNDSCSHEIFSRSLKYIVVIEADGEQWVFETDTRTKAYDRQRRAEGYGEHASAVYTLDEPITLFVGKGATR